MPRVKIRSFAMTIVWALLCFAFVTLLLTQVLPSTTAVIKVDTDVYLPAGGGIAAAAGSSLNSLSDSSVNNGGKSGRRLPPPPHQQSSSFDTQHGQQQQPGNSLDEPPSIMAGPAASRPAAGIQIGGNKAAIGKAGPTAAAPSSTKKTPPPSTRAADKLASDRFLDLHLAPTKLSYPNAEKAKVDYLNIHSRAEEAWHFFQNHIGKDRLYDPSDPSIEKMLRDLQKLEIVEVEEPDTGTQLKLFVTLENGARALFKPMRFDREHSVTNPNQFYFSDFERHNAEIAAYHLDRVLGFYRVPPTVGRVINITRDIDTHADKKLKRTIFVSPAGNKCFHGNCDYYCDTGHAICGKPDRIEGSFQALIPFKEDVHRHNNRSPWRRSYSKHRKAPWETDPFYCEEIEPVYRESRFLLDIMDVSIFDFLQGNQDRHHFDTFVVFANESFPVLFDNGRAFGRPDFDDVTIIAPVYQCCLVRYSTLKRLLNLHSGPKKLSEAFLESSRRDPVFPLLTNEFVEALDRRLGIVLETVRKCVRNNGFENVVFDDGL